MTSDENVTKVNDEDRKFIQDIARLPKEKRELVKGIVIGLQLDDQQSRLEGKGVGVDCRKSEKAKLSAAV